MSTPRIHAIVPAAGGGSRMGSATPKQYLRLLDRTLAEHTLTALLAVPRIDTIVVALAPDDGLWHEVAESVRQRVRVVTGGADRAASVWNALQDVAQRAAHDDWVLVHDMARPCIAPASIETMIDALHDHAVGGLLAVKVVDTIKRSNAQADVEETVVRAGLWQAQTPQMFRVDILRRGLAAARAAGMVVGDESTAVERLGLHPRLVEGSAANIKVTTREDLAMAEYFLGRGS